MNKVLFSLTFANLVFFQSCRYQKIDSSADSKESIFIEAINNSSFAPQISSFLKNKIREHIIKRGKFSISSTSEKSDLFLYLSFKNYKKSPEIYDPSDTVLASGLNLNSQVFINLKNADGELLIEDLVIEEGVSLLRENAISIPSDRQALIALCDLFARRISIYIENYNW